MIVHFERCHFKTFLGISKLPVGDLFYAKNVISHSALHTALRSLGPYKCFTAPAFFIAVLSCELGFLVAHLHTLSEGEKVIFLNGPFPLCHRR